MSGFRGFFSFRNQQQRKFDKILKNLANTKPKRATSLGNPVLAQESYDFIQILNLLTLKNKHGKNRVNPNTKNKHGHTILDLAIAFGNAQDVATLLDTTQFNEESLISALHSAAGCQKKDCIGLLANKVSVNATDSEGTTALMIAANYGSIECIEALIAYGANVRAKDHKGITALKYTIIGNKPECMNFLIDKYHVNITETDNNGYNAFMLAAEYGRLECIINLLNHGAQINGAENKNGYTALMVAASHGNTKMVKELIARGADVTQTNRRAKTAADVAKHYKRHKCHALLETEIKIKLKMTAMPDLETYLNSLQSKDKDKQEIIDVIKRFYTNTEQELSTNGNITCKITLEELDNNSSVELLLTKVPKPTKDGEEVDPSYDYTVEALTPGTMYKYALESKKKMYIRGTIGNSIIIAAEKGKLENLLEQCKLLCNSETNKHNPKPK